MVHIEGIHVCTICNISFGIDGDRFRKHFDVHGFNIDLFFPRYSRHTPPLGKQVLRFKVARN